jgi:hypothetical protein
MTKPPFLLEKEGLERSYAPPHFCDRHLGRTVGGVEETTSVGSEQGGHFPPFCV